MSPILLRICRALQRRSVLEFVTAPSDFELEARQVWAARRARGRYAPRRRKAA